MQWWIVAIVVVIYLFSLLVVSRVFNIKFAVALVKGFPREFKSWPGRASFAAFLMILFIGLSHNCMTFIERTVYILHSTPVEQLTTRVINPIVLIIIALGWLILNFLVLEIFEKYRTP